MARRREIPLGLSKIDDLFTTQDERDEAGAEKVAGIPIGLIDPFPEHPFQVRDDEEMAEMAESVRRYGVISPVLLRPGAEGRYELVSGHRRKRAAEIAGLAELPAVVREMTRDEAVVAMVDSNLQRERVPPSEKAYAYRMKLEAMSRQGERTDLTSSPLGMKLQGRQTLDLIGEGSGDSRSTVHRYIRLTELIRPLLDFVDQGEMGMRPAVELSYLPVREQAWVLDAVESEVRLPSHAQAIKLRQLSAAGGLTQEGVLEVMEQEKPNQVEKLHIPVSRISRFFRPGTSQKEMESRIMKALELLERQERRRGMER